MKPEWEKEPTGHDGTALVLGFALVALMLVIGFGFIAGYCQLNDNRPDICKTNTINQGNGHV